MYSNKNNNQEQPKKLKVRGPLKYIGMMGACCLLPILIVALLPLLQLNNLGANTLIVGMSSLICPIMMVVMMFTLFKNQKGHGCCSDDKKEDVNKENK